MYGQIKCKTWYLYLPSQPRKNVVSTPRPLTQSKNNARHNKKAQSLRQGSTMCAFFQSNKKYLRDFYIKRVEWGGRRYSEKSCDALDLSNPITYFPTLQTHDQHFVCNNATMEFPWFLLWINDVFLICIYHNYIYISTILLKNNMHSSPNRTKNDNSYEVSMHVQSIYFHFESSTTELKN